MDAALGFGLRHPLHAVTARLEFHDAIDPLTVDLDDHLLEATMLALVGIDDLGAPPLALGKTRIETEQITGEDRRLIAPRPGADFQITVVVILRILGQQQDLQLLLDQLDGRLGFGELLLGHGSHLGIIAFEHLEHSRQIGTDLLEALETGDHILELGVLLVQVTKALLIVDHARFAHQGLYFFITFQQAFELSDHRLFHTHSASTAAARIARH